MREAHLNRRRGRHDLEVFHAWDSRCDKFFFVDGIGFEEENQHTLLVVDMVNNARISSPCMGGLFAEFPLSGFEQIFFDFHMATDESQAAHGRDCSATDGHTRDDPSVVYRLDHNRNRIGILVNFMFTVLAFLGMTGLFKFRSAAPTKYVVISHFVFPLWLPRSSTVFGPRK